MVALVAGGVWISSEREAAAQPAVDAAVLSGIDKDTTAIGRLLAGGIWSLGKFAPEAHIGFDGFLRINKDKGIAARQFSLINLGARYAFTSDRFVGPYLSIGGGFGIFTGKPHERKVEGDAVVCESANIPDSQPQDQCVYRINKSVNGRIGFGYGFQSGKKTTVAARVDFHMWMLSLNDFEDQPNGAPVPNMVDRPVTTWTLTVGLEFMRWQ
jgi:hypothetical protein